MLFSGTLTVPTDASGVIVFAHGSGSSHSSPRNRRVAEFLNGAGYATYLFDLLTPAEQAERANVFDIELLGRRLVEATRKVTEQPGVSGLPVGYFGASTGAAAALWAAAEPDLYVRAVVSRGGRPDLTGERLHRVTAPTLLIVGGLDSDVLTLNWCAARQLRSACDVTVVPGASHLFEEPGALDTVAALARGWFSEHLAQAGRI